ncbi:saccharopine dehydrogenase NADP-binding domain-containing protein [Haliangium ochraceum]|uniref:Saccharopine dehydrogenase n=1 Tax=Haliangium ochraceum (strain DSM 14365 / JCM 11303 / SMP-2) TaxID=502025 RepID=D0LI30_HALO1|nr:saccharopine dehydrogenase NADP-binding domain-containing protein [Haliangium ochraceum]ACY14859.1 Saccharopine dehydrogenase [Haliangium ochraceum DSM 14365]
MSVLIYGATGLAGTLIARGLRVRDRYFTQADENPTAAATGPGVGVGVGVGEPLDLVLAGRDRRRLERLAETLSQRGAGELSVRTAPVHDAAALRAAMDGVDLVVNCAGPFERVGMPVVEAAVDVRVPYLDIAAEQRFLRSVYEQYESLTRHRETLIVSGMGMEIALGDLGLHVAAAAASGALASVVPPVTDEPAVDELAVAYALDDLPPTAAARESAVSSLSAPISVWIGDLWDLRPPMAERRAVNFGAGFGQRTALLHPAGEVITAPRHVRAGRVRGFRSMRAEGPLSDLATRVATALSPALPSLFMGALGAQARAQIAPRDRGSKRTRSQLRFAVSCEARVRFEYAHLVVSGADPHQSTARIACFAARSLLARARAAALPTGVRTPAEVFAPGATLEHLVQRCDLRLRKSF